MRKKISFLLFAIGFILLFTGVVMIGITEMNPAKKPVAVTAKPITKLLPREESELEKEREFLKGSLPFAQVMRYQPEQVTKILVKNGSNGIENEVTEPAAIQEILSLFREVDVTDLRYEFIEGYIIRLRFYYEGDEDPVCGFTVHQNIARSGDLRLILNKSVTSSDIYRILRKYAITK